MEDEKVLLKKVLLQVEYSAWIEPNGKYYAEYEKVFYEERDITDLVRQYRNIEIAIEEELAEQYPKTGENLLTAFHLYLPVELVREMDIELVRQIQVDDFFDNFSD